MYYKYYKNIFGLIYLLSYGINNFFILPFDTILIKDELYAKKTSIFMIIYFKAKYIQI